MADGSCDQSIACDMIEGSPQGQQDDGCPACPFWMQGSSCYSIRCARCGACGRAARQHICPRALPESIRRMMPGRLHREEVMRTLRPYQHRDGCYYGCRHDSGECYDPMCDDDRRNGGEGAGEVDKEEARVRVERALTGHSDWLRRIGLTTWVGVAEIRQAGDLLYGSIELMAQGGALAVAATDEEQHSGEQVGPMQWSDERLAENIGQSVSIDAQRPGNA